MDDELWLARFSAKMADPEGDASATRSVIIVLILGVMVGLCWAVLEATAPRPVAAGPVTLEPIVIYKTAQPAEPANALFLEDEAAPVINRETQLKLFQDTLTQMSQCQRHWDGAASGALRDLYIALNTPQYDAWSELPGETDAVSPSLLISAGTRVQTDESMAGDEPIRGLTRNPDSSASTLAGNFSVSPMECAVLRASVQQGQLNLVGPDEV